MKTLSLHILDLMQNAIKASASDICVEIVENKESNIYQIKIADNGEGINPDLLKQIRASNLPLKQGRGQGLLLARKTAEQAGGGIKIGSSKDTGTALELWFEHSHSKRLPLGDIAGVMVLTALSFPNIHFTYKHTTDSGTYFFDTNAVQEIAGSNWTRDMEVIRFLKSMIAENLHAINADL